VSPRKLLFIGIPVVLVLSLILLLRTRGGIPVQVVPVRRGAVAATVTSTTSGSVEPRLRATVNAELIATVTRKNVEEGARVAKGAVVIDLDPEMPLEELAAARASLEAARARTEQAQGRLTDAERELERTRALYAQKVISRKALDAAELARLVARRGLEEARASTSQLERSASVSRIRLEKAEVRAPFAGLVTKIHVDEGDSVTAGKPLFEIADDQRLHVEAPIDEIDASRVRVGQRAKLVPDAYPDRVFTGRIREVAPVVSTGAETNRTVEVKVALDPVAGGGLPADLKIGMSVDVEVILGEARGALYVPTFAVIDRGGRRFVLLADGGRARERAIETGLSNWDTTQVTSGLSEGERVITTLDDKKLGDGARIEVERGEPPRRRRERG
jgi:HlyD family secretion protein